MATPGIKSGSGGWVGAWCADPELWLQVTLFSFEGGILVQILVRKVAIMNLND